MPSIAAWISLSRSRVDIFSAPVVIVVEFELNCVDGGNDLSN